MVSIMSEVTLDNSSENSPHSSQVKFFTARLYFSDILLSFLSNTVNLSSLADIYKSRLGVSSVIYTT